MGRVSPRGNSVTLIFYALVFMTMMGLNHLTPLWGDDWWRAVDLSSVGDIFSRTIDEYLGWTGRSSVLLLTYMSLLKYPGSVFIFNCINSLVFVLFLRGIFRAAVGRYPESRILDLVMLFISFFSLWFFTQALGEAVFWKTGAVAYLWVVCASVYWLQIFVDMMAYRRLRPNSGVRLWILPVFAFALAMSLENVSLSILAFMSFALVHAKLRRLPLPRWYWHNFLAYCLGSITLIVAPGNFKRFAAQDDGIDIFQRFGELLAKVWGHGINVHPSYIAIFSLAALVALINRQDFHRLRCLYLWLLIAVMFAVSMILSTGVNYEDRTAFASEVGFIIVVVGLTYEVLRHVKDFLVWIVPVASLLLAIFIANFVPTFEQFVATYQQHQQRLVLMSAYRNFDVERILLPSIMVPGVRGLKDDIVDDAYFLRDVHLNIRGNEWRNGTYAQYYGFKFATRVTTPYLIFIPQLSDGNSGFKPLMTAENWLITSRKEKHGFRKYVAIYVLMPAQRCVSTIRLLANDKHGKAKNESISRTNQVTIVDINGQVNGNYCVFRKEIDDNFSPQFTLEAKLGSQQLKSVIDISKASVSKALPAFLQQKKTLSWKGCRLNLGSGTKRSSKGCVARRSINDLDDVAATDGLVTFGPYAPLGIGKYKVYLRVRVEGRGHRWKIVLHSDSAQFLVGEYEFSDTKDVERVVSAEFSIDKKLLEQKLGIKEGSNKRAKLEVVTTLGGAGTLEVYNLGVDISQ